MTPLLYSNRLRYAYGYRDGPRKIEELQAVRYVLSIGVQQDPHETSSKTSSSVSQPCASANGATPRRSCSSRVIASCRRPASRTKALLPVPVRAAASRNSASKRSSMRMVKVAMYYKRRLDTSRCGNGPEERVQPAVGSTPAIPGRRSPASDLYQGPLIWTCSCVLASDPSGAQTHQPSLR